MKIKELYIRKFGKLKDYKLVLSDGMNVLFGNNEAGKTTVFNFILAMLYGFSNTRGKGISDSARKKYMTWGENKIGGTMTVDHNGTTYVIDRMFGKTKAGDSLEFTNLTLGEQIALPSGREVGEYLFDLDEKSFKGTCFITQLSKDVCENDSVKTKLSNLSSAGDAEYSFDDVFDRLKASSLEITRKTSTGKIYPLENEKNHLEERNRTIVSDLAAINEIFRENTELEEKSKTLIAERSETEALIDRARKFKLAQEYRSAVEANGKIEKLRIEAQNSVGQITRKGFTVDRGYIDNLQSLINKREKARLTYEYEEKALENERKTYERLASSAKNEKPAKTSALPFAFALIAVILIAVLLFVILKSIIVSVAVFALLAVIVLCVYFAVNSKNKKSVAVINENELATEKGRLDSSVERFERSKNDYVLLNDEFKKQYLLFFEENEMERADENIKELALKLDEYVKAKSKYDAVKASAVSQDKLEQMQSSVDESVLNDENAKIDLSKVENRRNIINAELIDIEKKLLVNKERTGGKSKLEAELENNLTAITEINEKIFGYEYARDCLELAKQGLENAQTEMQKQFAPDVSRLVSEILSEITCGKYEQMTLNSNLQTMVVDNESGAAREDSYMSAGTLEQIYLALRLAMIKLVFADREYPVICMDDALLSFDFSRMKKATQYISDTFSKQTQVLFFTCRDTEKACFTDANLVNV